MNTTDNDNILEVGGHRTIVANKPRGLEEIIRRCLDCNVTGPYTLFNIGTRGCPMRPESLDYLSVCPGGERCEGHMDTSTEDYRVWKASTSMPSDLVPRFRCDAALLGVRAARQWLKHADQVGLKTAVWAQTAVADKVGAEGGKVAELTTTAGGYHIIVTRHGKLAAHPGLDFQCTACEGLKEKGDIAA